MISVLSRMTGKLFFIFIPVFLFGYMIEKIDPATYKVVPGKEGSRRTPDAMHPQNLQAGAGTKTDSVLVKLLKERPGYFNDLLSRPDSFRVQILYTQIDRQADNTPVFKDYYYNVNPAGYFYPASTVKMPVAALAIQRLNELKISGLDIHSTMITESNFSGETAAYNDPTAQDGRPSVAHYVKKIFLASDNDAFNRLYEFLGQDYINQNLQRMGFTGVQIRHRLALDLSEEENRRTNPVGFYTAGGKVLYTQPMQVSEGVFVRRQNLVGKSYYAGDTLVDAPMDFSIKNRVTLEDLSVMLRSILFPLSVKEHQRFNLKPDQYRFIWKYMSQFPAEASFPEYDRQEHWDAYGKFLLFGSEKGELPPQIRVFNKVGDAYGFLTDVAYIVDFEKNIEFMLAATVYCNRDQILNDDRYDYDSVGLPFMKNLGKLIYDHELVRKRRYPPDLSAFRMEYGE